MRVLHVVEALEGGIGRYLALLAAAQRESGWDVTVAAPAGGSFDAAVAASGARLVDWQATAQPGWSVLRECRALAAVVREVDPDLVHLHSSKAGLVGRLVVRRRRPTILQPHSWSFYAVTGPVRRATLAWERFAVRWTDLVLCVSQAEAQAAVQERVRVRCVVIPNGVDLAAHRAAGAQDRERARARLAVPQDCALVVCAARLHRQKGQHRLLDAWPAVTAAVPTARLVLVGDGPDRAALRARAVPGVDLVGVSSEVGAWFAAADVVAAPSTWEGMSLSVLEAMAAGRPVVATAVPGMRELVVDGVGALVPLDDPAALADALIARLRDPALAAREGAAARRLVERDHDLAQHLAAVLELTEACR